MTGDCHISGSGGRILRATRLPGTGQSPTFMSHTRVRAICCWLPVVTDSLTVSGPIGCARLCQAELAPVRKDELAGVDGSRAE